MSAIAQQQTGTRLCQDSATQRVLSGKLCTTSRRHEFVLTSAFPRSKCAWTGFGCKLGQVQHVRHTRSDSPIARMGIKWMENFEAKVDIADERKEELERLLENATFCKQVAAETLQDAEFSLEYTGMIFQPVPWSPSTPKGMPKDFEQYHTDPDYITINVPPNFLFQCKIFQPSRLCAIYRKVR